MIKLIIRIKEWCTLIKRFFINIKIFYPILTRWRNDNGLDQVKLFSFGLNELRKYLYKYQLYKECRAINETINWINRMLYSTDLDYRKTFSELMILLQGQDLQELAKKADEIATEISDDGPFPVNYKNVYNTLYDGTGISNWCYYIS